MKEKEKILDKNNTTLGLEKMTKNSIVKNQISKKKGLKERGITLIALVVTIIILLILAGVTLNIALSDGGLFSKTQEAADKYKQAQSDEEDLILKYEYEMAKLQGEISETKTVGEYAMEKEIKEKYEQNIEIGDTVNYDPNVDEGKYEGTWKVLGIEDGKILLMSSKPVQEDFKILGVEGYVNGVKNLDDICSEYGKGEGATGARSLRVEDINRITGYNPDKGEKYGEGKVKEYGAEVTLKKNESGTIDVSASNGQNFTWEVDTFNYISEDGTEKEFDGELVITNNMYEYETDSCKNWYTEMGHQTREMTGSWGNLFSMYSSNIWLANKVTGVSDVNNAEHGYMRYLYRALAIGGQGFKYVAQTFTDETTGKSKHDVSCVVSLDSSVNFELKEQGVWNIA